MDKHIKLYNYASEAYDVMLLDVERIVVAWIEVVSGDEVLTAVWDSGKHITYDSDSTRVANYFDAEYDVIRNGKFMLDELEWSSRKSSYWW